MKLLELEPNFIKRSGERGFIETPTLSEADGILFLCPVCFLKHKGDVGTHSIICWFRGKVPDDLNPGPGRWTPSGTDFSNLSFVPGQPPKACSVLEDDGHAHFHITNGEIILC
jgi:hypothetical protein